LILVDTSVWIDHLRLAFLPLAAALKDELVLVHPFVIGELACGNLKDRDEVIALLAKLPQPVVAGHEEVLAFIESRRLMERGIGYIDAHLLASAALSDNVRLWTNDKRLRSAAADLHLAY
jgi:predicted nucleic acid-binding protein